MSRTTHADDARSMNTKIKMSQHFAEERGLYEASDAHSIVYEDDDCVIVADHEGHELNEWANQTEDDRDTLRETFRALADEKMGEHDAHEAFSHSDPVVFDKQA